VTNKRWWQAKVDRAIDNSIKTDFHDVPRAQNYRWVASYELNEIIEKIETRAKNKAFKKGYEKGYDDAPKDGDVAWFTKS
jgi:hypothetical protein